MKWEQSNITSSNFASCYNANGLWVVAGYGLRYSIDGKSWNQSNITSNQFKSIYNANDIWVATSSSSNGIYYSIDGMSWTQSNITSGNYNFVYNANGIWIAGSDYNSGLYYSSNGMSWTHSNITSGILKGDGTGNVTAAEEAEVELVDLTIANVAGLQSALDANKGTAIAVTLASASWTGTAAPYTYTISNDAITATSNQELTPATDITADQLAALQGANIIDGGQAAGSMTLKAFGEKPSVDIPVRVIVKG